MGAGTIHKFKVPSIDGGTIDFSKFNGKKILVVNTASKCGYTPQYKDLEQLHKQYGTQLAVIGIPANNFGAQEPGSSIEIAEFCKKNYGVVMYIDSLENKSDKEVVDIMLEWNTALYEKYNKLHPFHFISFLDLYEIGKLYITNH